MRGEGFIPYSIPVQRNIRRPDGFLLSPVSRRLVGLIVVVATVMT